MTLVEVGHWAALNADAKLIRHEVFVVEQKVPLELETDDEVDAVSLHAVAYDNEGRALGAGRLLPDGHIGRMAVGKPARGSGVGSLLLKALVAEARSRGDEHIVLSAQAHAAPFYQRHGFVIEGEEFHEAGIPHVDMRYFAVGE